MSDKQSSSTDAVVDRCAHVALRLGPRLNRWMTARVNDSQTAHGMSLRQLTALYAIREESSSPGYLARRLSVTPAVVTGLIDRLERQGYVRRTSELTDRRALRLTLTEAGLETSLAVEQTLVGSVAAGMSDLSPEQLAILGQGLDILTQVLDKLEG